MQLVVLFHIRLDRDRQVRVRRRDLLLSHVVGIARPVVALTCGPLCPRGLAAATVRDPVDGYGVECHIGCAGGQADQATLFALEVHEGKHVGGTENQGNDRSEQRATGHVSQFALGGALEHGGGAHQGADEQDCEPGRDEDIVQNQGQRGWLLETNIAVAITISDPCISVDDHQGQDANIWHQQH